MVLKVTKREINKRPSHGAAATWSTKQRYEAVALYKLVGNLRVVSTTSGIPYDTIRKWHTMDWWKDYEQEIAKQTRAELTGKLGKIAEKAIKVVEDRLENGDYVFNSKTGNIMRKPVNAQQANRIFTDAVDRTILLEKLEAETKVVNTQEKLADRLTKLSETFRDIARTTRRPGNVIDVEPEDAVHEKREEGLHSGERTLQLEAREYQEEGREEQSPSNDGEVGQSPQG
jgi:hypothetical protein